jgi:prolyl-tRNA synthetase
MNDGRELGLAFTHEEALTNIMTNFVSSYKDLPIYAYQFQTKFRNELRAKAGIMRGREFLMKDLYDFSRSKQEHEAFYEKMKEVYKRIFARLGIGERTFLTISNGGTFSKYSFEFQTVCDAGEDVIVFDAERGIAINKDDFSDEVLSDFNLRKEDFNFTEAKSIEVGDIYSLGERFAQALGLTYKDETGKEVPVYMGSYGIGIPRLMGTIVEVLADERGIVWPAEVAPFTVHLIDIGQAEKAQELVAQFEAAGISVLWDDRSARPGEKFADADLMGMPWRVVLSERSLEAGGVELTNRASSESSTISIDECIAQILK